MLIGLSLACVVWVRKEQRQYALDRQLIAALKKNDSEQALSLVEAGANPDTRMKIVPPPSFILFISRLLHHEAMLENDSPTALIIACGNIWQDENWHNIGLDSANAPLAKAMLKHGGHVNAKGEYGYTALMSASVFGRTDIMTLLLQYGANINAQDKFGQSALHKGVIQIQPESVKALIFYKANVNIKDFGGWTPLAWEAEKGNHSPEIRRLLQRAGAKE